MGTIITQFAYILNTVITPEVDYIMNANPLDQARFFGYPAEGHNLTTSDGYILSLHRIPHGRNSTKIGPPVLLAHGIQSASADWLAAGPGHALGYMLADAGYDVWLINFRGNLYSRNHLWLDPDWDERFWNFSFHEMGVYDLPTTINYILTLTNQKKLSYIGHSQGTTSLYVLASRLPEYNDLINVQISLAPVAYLQHAKQPNLATAAVTAPLIEISLRALGIYEISQTKMHFFKLLYGHLCISTLVAEKLCLQLLWYTAFGFNKKETNYTTLAITLYRNPWGTSIKDFLHFLQSYKLKKFCDYSCRNTYNLSNIQIPMYMFYGNNDLIATRPDVIQLYTEIASANKSLKVIDDPKWTHDDFLFAVHVGRVINQPAIKILDQYNKKF